MHVRKLFSRWIADGNMIGHAQRAESLAKTVEGLVHGGRACLTRSISTRFIWSTGSVLPATPSGTGPRARRVRIPGGRESSLKPLRRRLVLGGY